MHDGDADVEATRRLVADVARDVRADVVHANQDLGAACSSGSVEGLAPAENTGGPKVLFDLNHTPLPEVLSGICAVRPRRPHRTIAAFWVGHRRRS